MPRVPSLAGAKKREQTVNTKGEYLAGKIDGVVTRPAERGTVCEIYNPDWGINDEPLVYVYQITVRPGQIKGWSLHRTYADRLFFAYGTTKVVLYDDREGSPTRGMVNEMHFDEHTRTLLVIPPSVWHAVKNVGSTESVFINCPTKPYDHSDPEKFSLPVDTDQIPYSF